MALSTATSVLPRMVDMNSFYNICNDAKCLYKQCNISASDFSSSIIWNEFSSIQFLSHVWLLVTPWIATRQASLSITNSHGLLKLMSIKWVMPSNHLILCCPLLPLPSIFHNNSSCLQSFSASGSFLRSQFFTSGGQNIGASASILPINIQDWFPLGLTGLISLLSKGLPRVFYSTTVKSINSFMLSFLYGPILKSKHDYWKNHRFEYMDLHSKVISLLFNMLYRLVIAFLPRSKCLLILWL